MHSRSLARVSLLALALGGCGRLEDAASERERDEKPPVDVQPPQLPRPQPASDSVAVFARRGEDLVLVNVGLEAGAITPFGGRTAPLPYPAGAVVAAEAWRDEVVRFDLASGTTRVETRRDDAWTLVDEAPRFLRVDVSSDLSLVWTSKTDATSGSADRTQQSAFTRGASAPLWQGSWQPYAEQASLLGFASQGVLLQAGRTVSLVRPSGTDVIGDVERSQFAAEAIVGESVLLRDGATSMKWLRFDGTSVDVPGFVPQLSKVRGRYVVDNGRLSVLEPDGVVEVLAFSGRPGDVLDVRAAGAESVALVGGTVPSFVDATGASFAVMTPQPFEGDCPSGMRPDSYVQVAGSTGLDADAVTLLLDVSYQCMGGDYFTSAYSALDVVRVDLQTHQHTARRLHSAPEREFFRLSSSGAFAYRIDEDGSIVRFDTRTAEERTLRESGTFVLGWPVHP